MGIEGGLIVRVHWDGRAVRGVEIDSSRPVAACRVFQGKPLEEVISVLPLLYTVCRTAHAVAVVEACQNVLGIRSRESVRRLRQRLVLAEIAQEYLWRFSLDWPRAMGAVPDAQSFAFVRNTLAGHLQPMLSDTSWRALNEADVYPGEAGWEVYSTTLTTHVEKEILGMPVQMWQQMDSVDALRQWSRDVQTDMARVIASFLEEDESPAARQAVPLMPPLEKLELEHVSGRLAADDAFARCPDWHGQPLETGALARMQAHPLVRALLEQGRRVLARVVARLLELAGVPRRIREATGGDESSTAVTGSLGEACVETARGLLLHRVEAEQGKARRYQILAPTEWNFHPAGALVQELKGVPATDEASLRAKVARAMLALDPCVEYEVKVMQHA